MAGGYAVAIAAVLLVTPWVAAAAVVAAVAVRWYISNPIAAAMAAVDMALEIAGLERLWGWVGGGAVSITAESAGMIAVLLLLVVPYVLKKIHGVLVRLAVYEPSHRERVVGRVLEVALVQYRCLRRWQEVAGRSGTTTAAAAAGASGDEQGYGGYGGGDEQGGGGDCEEPREGSIAMAARGEERGSTAGTDEVRSEEPIEGSLAAAAGGGGRGQTTAVGKRGARTHSSRLAKMPHQGLPTAVQQQLSYISHHWPPSFLDANGESSLRQLVPSRKQEQLLLDLLLLFNVLLVEVPSVVGCNNPQCVNLTGETELAGNKTCKGCGVAVYCSTECQKAHRKWHKVVCRRLQGARQAEAEDAAY